MAASNSVMTTRLPLPLWTIAAPVLGVVLLLVVNSPLTGGLIVGLTVFVLMFTVFAAVHHAEVVAHKVGEPYGTLVLALAITVIEVALIVSLMISGGPATSALARDTVFAAVMLILNGIIGICLLVGASRHHEQRFGLYGVSASLTTLAAIATLTLVLPNYTTSIAGPYYNNSQLIFVAIVSLVLYGAFVLVQAVRHRDYFLPPKAELDAQIHADPPSNWHAMSGAAMLLISLVVVVLLAKTLAPSIELLVSSLGAPNTLVGIIIAAVVLLPEGLAAFRAARANRLQTSLNLALGSALASIGLTIPAVALLSIVTGLTLTLGLDIKSTVLLLLSLFVCALSLGTGRTTVLQGTVHLVILATYLFTTIVP
jgi:Ca2+:H+ antiporter